MVKKTFILIAIFSILSPVMSFGFDCNKPDFGATLQELNKDGYFIKYMEKDGVSYYNFTGACKMEAHYLYNPAISFAFIDGKLFARIFRASGTDLEDRVALEQRLSKLMGISDMKKKQEGDLRIYQWRNEKEKTTLKIKINEKTREQKGAYYYEPLRELLKAKMNTKDPVDEME
jgi:hypothetical protein